MASHPITVFLINHKFMIILGLLVVNILLFMSMNNQSQEFHGTIETPEYNWIVYSNQFTNHISFTYSFTNKETPTLYNSFVTPYTFDQINQNTLLLKNDNQKIKIHLLTIYTLDKICSLIFRDSEQMMINNVYLSCNVPN